MCIVFKLTSELLSSFWEFKYFKLDILSEFAAITIEGAAGR